VNLDRIEELTRRAAANGAELVVTPEGAVEGYLINDVLAASDRSAAESRFRDAAEPVDGPAVTRIRALARELGLAVVLGFLERDGDWLYNTCVYIDAGGDILHRHRKTHMMQPYFEPAFYRPGQAVRAFDSAHGRTGILICFERQIPELATTLALDGARLLLVPSYGSRGDWNDALLRARARENGMALVFVHPEQSLFVDASGSVISADAEGEDLLWADVDLPPVPSRNLAQRRPEVFADSVGQWPAAATKRHGRADRLRVAVVQMRCAHSLERNTATISDHIRACAARGARVVVFPECVTTGYFADEIPGYDAAALVAAETRLRDVCRENRVYAVLGTPWYAEDGTMRNTAVVLGPDGEEVYRQAKIQLVPGDRWAVAGNALGLFEIDGTMCSLIVCHDSRYPELVRLPVLKGSRVIFYLSWESDITAESKLEPYRAQVVARAVENSVYVIQANAPQTFHPLEGSHGQSRIVAPDGTLLAEAPVGAEAVLEHELDLNRANAGFAVRSATTPFLSDWWRVGLECIDGPNPTSR
jgi:predicted amidohydrolase